MVDVNLPKAPEDKKPGHSFSDSETFSSSLLSLKQMSLRP